MPTPKSTPTGKTITGLDRLIKEKKWQEKIKGKIGLLCHNASVTKDLQLGLIPLKKIFGKRLIKLFGPQHGLFTDVQDNMIETKHFVHPYFGIQVYSLYSETRIPTKEMLSDLDTLIVDLQDVGTRIYTYIYTLTLIMKAAKEHSPHLHIVVLDRPNPASGLKKLIEGNILEEDFISFVGMHPGLPVRHSLSIGEIAQWASLGHAGEEYAYKKITVIPMKGWKRNFFFEQTGLTWVLPSPNLSHPHSALTFPGTVLYEGTNISEGRGTTRALEILGHPQFEPYSHHTNIMKVLTKEAKIPASSFVLRPLSFMPAFQKHGGQVCGGYQIHVLNPLEFKPWRCAIFLLREFYHILGEHFSWKQPPYEYEYHKMPIDMICGSDKIRHWVEKKGSLKELLEIEEKGQKKFLKEWQQVTFKIYS